MTVVSEGELETLLPPELTVSYTSCRDITYLSYTDVGVVSRGGLLGVRCKSLDSFNDEGIDDLLPKGREADNGRGRAGLDQPFYQRVGALGNLTRTSKHQGRHPGEPKTSLVFLRKYSEEAYELADTLSFANCGC